MKTALISSDTYLNHDTGPGHPEQIARVTVINENLKKLNNKNILWKKPSIITDDIIKDTHDKSYVDFVKNSFPTKPNSKPGDIFLINLKSEVPPVVDSLGLILVIFLMTFCIIKVVLFALVKKASPETL